MSYWDNIDREATKEWEHQQAFERANISEECLNDIRMIKNNQPTDCNEILLNPDDANQFTDQAWRLLGRYIANNTHLVKIDLNGCHLTDEKMSLLFSELVKSTSLKILILNVNEFGIAGVQKIVPLLRQANLSKLFMRGNASINTACFELVISALDGKSIELLDFDRCSIGNISVLETYNLPNLKRLEMNEMNIGREGCITISNLLQKEDTRLEVLYLDNADIDDEGAELIAASLGHNSKLTFLTLEQNNLITERGYSALLKVLVDVSSIENTYNSNNMIEGCIVLSKLLQREDSNLNYLYLKSTGIDDEGAEVLAAALKHNTKLKTLNLDVNYNITEKGYRPLLKVLVDVSSIENTYDSNHTLVSYGLENNTTSNRLKSLINLACNVNRICSTPEGVCRAKVIKYHLNSQTLKELCHTNIVIKPSLTY